MAPEHSLPPPGTPLRMSGAAAAAAAVLTSRLRLGARLLGGLLHAGRRCSRRRHHRRTLGLSPGE